VTEEEDETVFTISGLPFQSYEKDKRTQMDITFERDLNLRRVQREGYTVLDWISDIGGVQGILTSAVAIFLSYWNFNLIENHMVA